MGSQEVKSLLFLVRKIVSYFYVETQFSSKGILFKFAIDFEGIYGGDEGAMKAAGQELKGLTEYFQCNISGLSFPLVSRNIF